MNLIPYKRYKATSTVLFEEITASNNNDEIAFYDSNGEKVCSATWLNNNWGSTYGTPTGINSTMVTFLVSSGGPPEPVDINYAYFTVSAEMTTISQDIIEIAPIITKPLIFMGVNHNLGNANVGLYNLKDGFTEAFSYTLDSGVTVIEHNAITKIRINGLKPSINNIYVAKDENDQLSIILQKDVSGKVRLFARKETELLERTDYEVYTETGFNSQNVRYTATIYWKIYGSEDFPSPSTKQDNNCLIEFNDGELLIDEYLSGSYVGLKIVNIDQNVSIYGLEASYIIEDSFDISVENVISQIEYDMTEAKQEIIDIKDDLLDLSDELNNKFNSFTQMYVSR